MRKSLSLIALIVAAIAFAAGEASAAPLSNSQADHLCRGSWAINMNTGTRVCAWCEKISATQWQCHYIACDQQACDYFVVSGRPKQPKVTLPRPPVGPPR